MCNKILIVLLARRYVLVGGIELLPRGSYIEWTRSHEGRGYLKCVNSKYYYLITMMPFCVRGGGWLKKAKKLRAH